MSFMRFFSLFFFSLVSLPSLAADVQITITQNGAALSESADGFFHIFQPGEKSDYLEYTRSGGSVTIPDGTYDIKLEVTEGDAAKEVWLTNQRLAGTVNRTIDVALPVARLTYKITNGGVDVGDDKGWFNVFPVGDAENRVSYTRSGHTLTVPEGMYDVRIDFNDGFTEKIAWEKNIKLAGNVSRTFELGQNLARVTYTITRQGVDVGRNGYFTLHLPGEKEDRVGYASSKETATVPAGTYDIKIEFQEGGFAQEFWIPNQPLSGDVQRTYELNLKLASVKVTLTDKGIDLKEKAWFGLYAIGDRESQNYMASNNSGGAVTIAQGTYDLGLHYAGEGGLNLNKWIPNFVVTGNVDKTIAMDIPLAEVTVHVTRGGKSLPQAWCGVFPDGEKGEAAGKANSDIPFKTAEGTFDVGCFINESGKTFSKWLPNQVLKGKVDLKVELETVKWASLTILPSTAATAGQITPVSSAPKESNIEIILDASGSMVAKADATRTRMDVAKGVLTNVIKTLPESNVNVALRVYGMAPKSTKNCKDSQLLIPRGKINKEGLTQAIQSVKLSGYTPIAYNLEQAQADFPVEGNNSIILVTDGIESCGGDPCVVASKLQAQGLLTRAYVVGFGLEKDKGRFLECIGSYYPANNEAELAKALSDVFASSVKPLEGTVTITPPANSLKVVARGVLGEKITFPSGIYDVVIQVGAKKITWPALALDGNMTSPMTEAPPGKK